MAQRRAATGGAGRFGRVAALGVVVVGLGVSACASGSARSAASLGAHAWEHVRATASASGRLPRWTAGSELTVRTRNLSERDEVWVYRAFDAWLEGAGTGLTVRPAGAFEVADIVIEEVEEIAEGYESLGLTALEWAGTELVRVEVRLARTSRCGDRVTERERRRTLLHEVGHALGLGHTPRLSSIMHRNAPASTVDASDRAALRLLYAVTPVRAVAAAPELED